MRILEISSVAAILSLVGACSLDITNNAGQPAQLRVVNAAPGTTAVTAHLNGATESMTTSLAFKGQTAGCALILPAQHDIVFRQGTNTLGTATADFAAGQSYTIVLVNTGAAYRALALSDASNPVAASHGLRFINATASAGDVYVSPPGVGPSAIYKAIGNLAPLATTNEIPAYVYRPESDMRIRLYDVGTTTTPRADITLGAVFTSGLATVVFTEPTSAGDPGAFQVNPCG